MHLTQKSCLAHHILVPEFYDQPVDQILKIFQSNLSSVCPLSAGNLIARLKKILHYPLTAREKMQKVQTIVLSYPQFLKNSLLSLSSSKDSMKLFHLLSNFENRHLIKTILWNTSVETLEIFLTLDENDFFYKLLQNEDAELIRLIPLFLFTKILSFSLLKNPTRTISCLNTKKILSMDFLFTPSGIKNGLLLIAELCRTQIGKEIAEEIFLSHKEALLIGFFETTIDDKDPFTMSELDLVERYYISVFEPSLAKILQSLDLAVRNRQGICRTETIWTLAQETAFIGELEIPFIVAILKAKNFLRAVQQQNPNNQSILNNFAIKLFHRLALENTALDHLCSLTPYGISLLASLLFHKIIPKDLCHHYFPFLKEELEDLTFLSGEHYTLQQCQRTLKTPFLESPPIAKWAIERGRFIQIGDLPVPAEQIFSLYFEINPATLSILPPVKLRECFLCIGPKIALFATDRRLDTNTQSLLNLDFENPTFNDYLTTFYFSVYFPNKNKPAIFRPQMAEHLHWIPTDFFFYGMARPVLRNYIVGMAMHLQTEKKRALFPLLKENELYNLIAVEELEEVKQILSFLHPDQLCVVDEYLHGFFQRFDLKKSAMELESLQSLRNSLNSFRGIYPFPTFESRLIEIEELISRKTQEILRDDLEQKECCPITLLPPVQPVQIDLGGGRVEKEIYDRSALTRWIAEHGSSPLTRAPVTMDQIRSIPTDTENSCTDTYNPFRILTILFLNCYRLRLGMTTR
ncbi:MAG: hypothetical protein FJZ61_05240 [Chlamydiae bacterium]|nr:hypothetical protein [Chlamydiota bacterium]